MKYSIAAAGFVAAVAAQRPADQSICDYYTTALLMENNATTQQTVLTLVVNTAVIGNYTQPNVGIAVPGILAPGTGEYEGVNLLPYFSGALASTNTGGSMGRSVNFLDGGGAAPLMMNMPANDTSSAQYRLLTHLYSYFGGLLGCSQFANTTGQYMGDTSQYQVHKFMGLDEKEVGWFIQNVGMSAASFGVTEEDVTAVGKALMDAFGYRCSPPAAIPATAEPELQSICIAESCPIAPANATCAAYEPVIEPSSAVPSAGMPTGGSNSTTPKPTGGMTPTASMPAQFTGAAGALLPNMGAAAMGAAALLLL